ncbi:hypothetical protein PIB30_099594, partial [Stylosanthes scabra]|nr:hypothetical protein [Stylosanthes scabra]
TNQDQVTFGAWFLTKPKRDLRGLHNMIVQHDSRLHHQVSSAKFDLLEDKLLGLSVNLEKSTTKNKLGSLISNGSPSWCLEEEKLDVFLQSQEA